MSILSQKHFHDEATAYEFIEAKQIGVDETGEEFERALDKVLIKNDSHNTDSVK